MNLREIYLKHRLGEGQLGQLEFIPEKEPALYFLGEILALRYMAPEELREVHRAKLAFPGQRLIQDTPQEMHL